MLLDIAWSSCFAEAEKNRAWSVSGLETFWNLCVPPFQGMSGESPMKMAANAGA